MHEVIERLKANELPGLETKLLTGPRLDAVVESDFEHKRHDEHADGINAGLPRQIDVQASGQRWLSAYVSTAFSIISPNWNWNLP